MIWKDYLIISLSILILIENLILVWNGTRERRRLKDE